jgi:formylglycine-generating enzyme required for sulfatase activity
MRGSWFALFFASMVLVCAAVGAPAGPTEGQAWTVPELDLALVWVAPGSFQMGSNDGSDDEKPVHEVRLTRGYWLGKTEVTQGQWQAVMGKTVAEQRDLANREWPLRGEGAQYPIYYVSWEEAVEFCRKLTERDRAAGRLPAGYEYRLPTEAEWEYAARGGNRSRGFTYSGSNKLEEVGWFTDNSGSQTQPVEQKLANELGLFDMSGNVWEWCHDWYDSAYYGKSVRDDPGGAATGSLRVRRGGGWYFDARCCRSAFRGRDRPGSRFYHFGFRLAVAPAVR